MKKNILIGGAVLTLILGIFIVGAKFLTDSNNNDLMAKEIEEKAEEKEVPAIEVNKVDEKKADKPAEITPAEKSVDISIPKTKQSYVAQKKEIKKKIAKKKADKKKNKKVKAKKKTDNERYASTLSEKEAKEFLKKKKKERKVVVANEDTVPNVVIKQTDGSTVKVDEPFFIDEKGKKKKVVNKKNEFNWEEIVNAVLKDENGNWIDNSTEGIRKREAKEMGISVKEYIKLEKEGYFNQGKVSVSEGGKGDGTPEDDAGME